MAGQIVEQQGNPMGRRLESRPDWKMGFDLVEPISGQKVQPIERRKDSSRSQKKELPIETPKD